LSGRQAEARANDARILAAARKVFLADPDAPITAVAQEAGVGIGALYRRYRSSEELMQTLALQGLHLYNAEIETALADERDAWEAFSAFMHNAIAAGGGSLSRRFAGRFAVTDELREAGIRSVVLTQQLIERCKAAGVLRPDIDAGDMSMIAEAIQSISVPDLERSFALRGRYLTVVLAGLRAGAAEALPSTAPTLEEMRRRFEP
jgi:AcrR family transcriptional regulator